MNTAESDDSLTCLTVHVFHCLICLTCLTARTLNIFSSVLQKLNQNLESEQTDRNMNERELAAVIVNTDQLITECIDHIDQIRV